MLLDLHVRNLAVLAEASVRFGPGLNVHPGEPGAGMSLVVASVPRLGGAGASADLIRAGAERLTVTGVFEPAGADLPRLLEEAGLAADGSELVVRREIGRTGRNRVFVNDEPVTLKLLARLAPSLLRIHVQQEELGLLDPELQRSWLDRSEGDGAREPVAAVERRHAEYHDAAERLARAAGDDRLRLERIDLLRFQTREIDAARLAAGEELELRSERGVLQHAEAIARALGGSVELLTDEDGAATERLSRAARALREIAEWEPDAPRWAAEIGELRIRLEELAGEQRRRLERVEADPQRLDALEERLALVERLCRKFGDSTAEVLAYRERIGAELEDLAADDDRREELRELAGKSLESYRQSALELSRLRRGWGESLAGRVHRELADLAMGKARFSVRLERRRQAGSPFVVDGVPVEFGPRGIDAVVFELAANPGEESRPLAKVASGGELSRVYLALQLAIRGRDEGARPVLVFDEVDAGIGGAAAAALGSKLQRLARGEQILVVTHLPQVASFADQHFRVSKTVRKGRTHMAVAELDAEGRVQEVARMLAGREVTDISRTHAEELIGVAERTRG